MRQTVVAQPAVASKPKAVAKSRPQKLSLDHARIAQLQNEDAKLMKMLGGYFSEADDESGAQVASPTMPVAVASFPGLDAEHTDLLIALLERDQWQRGEFEALAAARALMPDGALEQVNEACIDATGDVLLEEAEGGWLLNPGSVLAVRELLR